MRFVAHYQVGGVGHFRPVKDVFRASQDASGLLETGLQVRWSGRFCWLDKYYFFDFFKLKEALLEI